MKLPRIVITLDTLAMDRRGVPFPGFGLKAGYVAAVEAAGGLPILAAPSTQAEVIEQFGECLDGLVVTGGDFDIAPETFGAVDEGTRTTKPTRTSFEHALIGHALRRGRPILGICGGMQLLNVVLGGTLVQDIRTDDPSALEHEQLTSPSLPDHPVELEPSWISRTLGKTQVAVNTTHHQAIAELGSGLELLGSAPDGVVELIGDGDARQLVGAQWHPELLDDALSRLLYANLVAQAKK